MAARVTSPVSGAAGHAGEFLGVPVVPPDDQLEEPEDHHDAADHERPQPARAAGVPRPIQDRTSAPMPTPRTTRDDGRIGQRAGGGGLFLLPLGGELLRRQVIQEVVGI